jgi:2-phosphosulfolactate phosphatase
MRRIHVITQKEFVDPQKIKESTAVVVDVLLATSVIGFALDNGFQSITTVRDEEEGLHILKKETASSILMGENKGIHIEGMEYPDPLLFWSDSYKQKDHLILLTTNGTVAINNAAGAKDLYVSSLLNGHIIAKELYENREDTSIVIVCAGNSGRFSMEDFIGAGQIIHHLVKESDYSLSDSSLAALECYRATKQNQFSILHSTETAQILQGLGFGDTVSLIVERIEKVDVLPKVKGGKIVNSIFY